MLLIAAQTSPWVASGGEKLRRKWRSHFDRHERQSGRVGDSPRAVSRCALSRGDKMAGMCWQLSDFDPRAIDERSLSPGITRKVVWVAAPELPRKQPGSPISRADRLKPRLFWTIISSTVSTHGPGKTFIDSKSLNGATCDHRRAPVLAVAASHGRVQLDIILKLNFKWCSDVDRKRFCCVAKKSAETTDGHLGAVRSKIQTSQWYWY